MSRPAGEEHRCPWWFGWVLLNPLRALWNDPEHAMGDWVGPGDLALDLGAGMGFFTLPLARRVGPGGRVVAVDVQPEMLRVLERRARRAGLDDRIEARACSEDALGIDDLEGQARFALAFAVLHEARRPQDFLASVHRALAPGGRLLLAEPRGHVPRERFEAELALAGELGFGQERGPRFFRWRTALLVKPGD